MKKKLIIILLAFLLVAPAAYSAEPWSKVSAEKTAAAAITTTDGLFYGIAVITDGTNAVTVSIYDNASAASGTELIPTWVVTSSSTDRAQAFGISPGAIFYNGIYVDITTGGTVTYKVYYKD